MKRTSILALVTVAFSICGTVVAQTNPNASERAVAAHAKKRAAYDALKLGAPATALDSVKANVDASNSRKAELQVGDQLREIALWLANERHPRAIDSANLALAEGDKVKGKITAAEEADLEAAHAQIYDSVVGDATKAKQAYQRAVQLQPNHPLATKALARIALDERRVAEKALENEAMRRRNQIQGAR